MRKPRYFQIKPLSSQIFPVSLCCGNGQQWPLKIKEEEMYTVRFKCSIRLK